VLELVSLFVPRLELFQARECDGNRDEGSNVSRARKIEGAGSKLAMQSMCKEEIKVIKVWAENVQFSSVPARK